MKGFTCIKCCNVQKRERTKVRMKTDDEFRKHMNRKNYEIRTLKDLSQGIQYIEPIGPFIPISPIY